MSIIFCPMVKAIRPTEPDMNPLPLRLLTPLALLVVLSGCNSKADPVADAPQPRPVLAAKVEATGSQQSAYTGVVAARTESDLGFRVSGKVIERKVDPGQPVNRGDTLLVLDIAAFDLALRSAKNRVNAAQAQLRQRRDDENRYQRLANTGAVSRQIFDQSATNLRVAEAELAAAQSDASQIENRRTYSVLKADGDGIITDVRVERGQVVAEGQVVARLAHGGAREAIVNLPENSRDQASQRALALPFGAPDQAVTATLRELATQQLLEKAFNINGGALRDYLRDALGASRRIDNRDLPINNARDLLAMSHVIELGSADHAATGFRLRIEPTEPIRDEHYFVRRDGFLLELEQDDSAHATAHATRPE